MHVTRQCVPVVDPRRTASTDVVTVWAALPGRPHCRFRAIPADPRSSLRREGWATPRRTRHVAACAEPLAAQGDVRPVRVALHGGRYATVEREAPLLPASSSTPLSQAH